ncbi:MAG: hypothetical protein FJY67_09920 [Calditrichaeota bacterium]|nr:hypothetical protein [Calditrichota bacterium]
MRSPHERLVAGAMTGTSMDGIDLALVLIKGRGLAMKATIVRTLSAALPDAELMRSLADGRSMTSSQISELAYNAANAHRQGLQSLLGGDRPDLIVLHGQTVYHRPPRSWQLIDPWPVAVEFGAPVCFDLRGADLAADGEGAPITPLADFVLYGDSSTPRNIVNLGGFANFTHLPARGSREPVKDYITRIQGGDLMPCNHLLDGAAWRLLGKPFDQDGAVAMAGAVDPSLFKHLVSRLESTGADGRSLGSGDEAKGTLDDLPDSSPSAILRTVTAVIAEVISRRLPPGAVVLAGGGACNLALYTELRDRSRGQVHLSDELGIPVSYRESAAMAVLGALAMDGVDITLPQVTGRRKAIRPGCWIHPTGFHAPPRKRT